MFLSSDGIFVGFFLGGGGHSLCMHLFDLDKMGWPQNLNASLGSRGRPIYSQTSLIRASLIRMPQNPNTHPG